jgi:hypothetical protein
METEGASLSNLAWETLFNERPESIPDPNQPENSAYINAVRRQRTESIRLFAMGGGKVLYDEWIKKIRAETIALLVVPKASLCNCPACMIIREIRPRLELILEAEKILLEDRKNKE